MPYREIIGQFSPEELQDSFVKGPVVNSTWSRLVNTALLSPKMKAGILNCPGKLDNNYINPHISF